MEVNVSATVSTAKTITVYLKDSTTGAAITGASGGDFSPIYARKEGGPSFSVAVSGANFNEVDALNLPGLYELDLTASILDTLGELMVLIPLDAGTLTNEEVVIRVNVEAANVSVDFTPITTSLDEIKGGGFDTVSDSLAVINAAYTSEFADIVTRDARILGLLQENITIDGHTYDGNGNLIQSSLKIYPSRDDLILNTNMIASYTMLASYDGSGRLTNYSVRLDP